MVAAIKSDPILAKMLAAKVTFLKEDLLKAIRINITKRTFNKGDSAAPSKANLTKHYVKPTAFEY